MSVTSHTADFSAPSEHSDPAQIESAVVPPPATEMTGGSEQETPWGFGAGLGVGALLTLAALGIGVPEGGRVSLDGVPAADTASGVVAWVTLNLGHSFWFFALVLLLYALNLRQLHGSVSYTHLTLPTKA